VLGALFPSPKKTRHKIKRESKHRSPCNLAGHRATAAAAAAGIATVAAAL